MSIEFTFPSRPAAQRAADELVAALDARQTAVPTIPHDLVGEISRQWAADRLEYEELYIAHFGGADALADQSARWNGAARYEIEASLQNNGTLLIAGESYAPGSLGAAPAAELKS